ncbi:beta strand repeat-containing protein [Aerosakkonema funiforme]|uniref:Right-handed parallel beta-helix repeat-containing protein n=1 Tax=Aerosakkonema funiforme FACHB-1375 TaxID=2949571 RepID=A0A926VKC7_9CYAN|nr:Calx-beta domain-containing protein [Aerosakkonema funiforme]MBD2185492.1 right-handed parallel beta-helix repeat-containing protein [Aerosakkonema funiforme FACHB-1375]
MATNPITGVLGRNFGYTNDTTGINAFKAEWLTAAQNQGIQIYGTSFNGIQTDYLTTTAQNNLNFSNGSTVSYGDEYGMGVANAYYGWWTATTKVRAEINYNPNTGQSETLTYKWAPNKTIQDAFIDLSLFVPKSAEGAGTEVGFLQAFKNGAPVSVTGVRMVNENTVSGTQTSIQNATNGVTFLADDGTNGDFKFKVFGAFDELRFSSKAYANPSATQPTYTDSTGTYISDSSDYLVQQIKYTGTEETIGSLQFSNPVFTVNENGTPVAAVTVTRTGGSFGAVSGTVNLSNGTATAPGDYTSTPIVVNFADGDTAPKTVLIPITDDTLIEPTETINLTLTNPTNGATIGTQNTATLNVVDNDTSLQFSQPVFSVNEDGTPVVTVTVTRTGDTTAAVGATVNLSNGTATAPGDYTNSPITVNFAAGDNTPKTITIPVVDDTLVEGNETINLTLTNPTGGATIGTQGTATLTVIDNDTPGTIQFSNPQYVVGEDGTPVLAVTLNRTGGSAGAVSATVNLADGTAVAPADYANNPIVVNWANGDTASKIVTIPIVDDTLVEPDETVNLSLSNPTGGATIGTQNTATLTILDNDVPLIKPVVFVAALDPVAGEPGHPDGNGAFQFARTGGDITQPLTIRYTTTGTATAGSDYTPLTGTVTIAAGSAVSAPVTITPLTDSINEATESVVVTVAEDIAYQVGSADSSTVRIAESNPLIVPNGAGSILRYNSSGTLLGSFNNFTTAVAGSAANDILVAQSGTYTEPGTVTIDKPLTIRGANAGISPTSGSLNAPSVVSGPASQAVFTLAGGLSNVTIEGLRIQTNSENAIRLQSAGSNIVVRQNEFFGPGGTNTSIVYLDANGAAGSSASVIDNLIRDVTTAPGSVTSGVQAFRFDTVTITDNQIANLTGPGVAADAITGMGIINHNTISNIAQQGIQLAGGNATIDNNDITNANTSSAADRGGIRLRSSGLVPGLNLGTVDVLSNTITNSFNGVAIANGTSVPATVAINDNNLIGNANAALYHGGSGTLDATNNWWDSNTGPIVGGTGVNHIAGAGAGLVTYNPFSTTPM